MKQENITMVESCSEKLGKHCNYINKVWETLISGTKPLSSSGVNVSGES